MRAKREADLKLKTFENESQINKNNYVTMFFMSKQVSLPKISSILQEQKIGPKSDIHPFCKKSSDYFQHCIYIEWPAVIKTVIYHLYKHGTRDSAKVHQLRKFLFEQTHLQSGLTLAIVQELGYNIGQLQLYNL